MALYTRQEYEEDLRDIGERAAVLARMLIAHEIDPMQYREMARRLDNMEKAYKAKLAITRLVIEDRQKMGKSKLFAWVIGAQVQDAAGKPVEHIISTRRDGKPILCKWQGWNNRFVPTTVAKLYNLRAQGVTLLEQGRGSRGKGKPPETFLEQLERENPQRRVTKAQGLEIVRRGGMAFFPAETPEEAVTRDEWLLEAPEESWPYPPGYVFEDGRIQE